MPGGHNMRRVTVEQIREALSACDGKVARAARVLGLARNNLYKRLASTGISPDEFRGNSARAASVSGDAHAAECAPLGNLTAVGTRVPVSRPAIFPAPARPRTFHAVSTEPMSLPPDGTKQLRLSRSVYLRPDQIKALDDACLDLPRVLREKLSPSKVLERFLDDCFGGWLASKLETADQRPATEARIRKEHK